MRGTVIHGTRDVRLEERPDPTIVEPTDADELRAVLKFCGDGDIPVRMLGGGFNLLVRDDPVPGAVVRLTSAAFTMIEWDGKKVVAGGGGAVVTGAGGACAAGGAGVELTAPPPPPHADKVSTARLADDPRKALRIRVTPHKPFANNDFLLASLT